jgi:hypothetical protein
VNIIDSRITPDPFNPQPGDVYEYDAPTQTARRANEDHYVGPAALRTRIVVNNVNLSNSIIKGVWFEVNGEAQNRECARFPLYLASLAGCVALGRVAAPTTPAATETL